MSYVLLSLALAGGSGLCTSCEKDHAVEENHVIDWDKAKVVDREAQRQTMQMDKRGTLDHEDTDVLCMNRDAGSYQLSHTWDQVISRSRAPSSCKQSRRDQERTIGHSLKFHKKRVMMDLTFLFGQDCQQVELIKRRHTLGFIFERFQRKTTKIA